ncbi:ROK family transcriptional regulator [Salinibacterium soli]|uniref:ROK family transcriptional regulator n=1 Tax=Antiquaquibacter soli TaxID=3064523 RepID=A0ABT9BQI7_9MICO|nr:ROK family transcriptional regulator [Protaetiibacter sp. WY-16]MDO7883296.1 ROK family transcriptional regulator [Protaetiibacter sp. WY-16]
MTLEPASPAHGVPPAGSPSLLWSINARAVLDIVARLAPVARPEIRRASGLSKTAVAQTLAELERRGIVVVAGHDSDRRGPVATLYALDERYRVAAAVDVGHHRVRAVLVGTTGEVLARADAPAEHSSAAATAAEVAAVIERCCATAGLALADLAGAVVGVAATVTASGALLLADGLADEGRGLPEALAAALPFAVTLENDTNLAAIAEQRVGAARELSDFVLLSVGASVGAGIVIGGRVHRGTRGAAGEVNYLPGRDDVVDGTLGSASVAADAAEEGLPSTLSARDVFERARTGDAAALRVVDRTAARLARVIATLGLVLDPEAVILGGAIGGNGDLLTGPVADRLADAFPHAGVAVLTATAGEDAVLDGAASLAAQLARSAAFDAATAV